MFESNDIAEIENRSWHAFQTRKPYPHNFSAVRAHIELKIYRITKLVESFRMISHTVTTGHSLALSDHWSAKIIFINGWPNGAQDSNFTQFDQMVQELIIFNNGALLMIHPVSRNLTWLKHRKRKNSNPVGIQPAAQALHIDLAHVGTKF